MFWCVVFWCVVFFVDRDPPLRVLLQHQWYACVRTSLPLIWFSIIYLLLFIVLFHVCIFNNSTYNPTPQKFFSQVPFCGGVLLRKNERLHRDLSRVRSRASRVRSRASLVEPRKGQVGPGRARVTRPDPLEFGLLLARPGDPTRPVIFPKLS